MADKKTKLNYDIDLSKIKFHAPIEETEYTGILDNSTNKKGYNPTEERKLLERETDVDKARSGVDEAVNAVAPMVADVAGGLATGEAARLGLKKFGKVGFDLGAGKSYPKKMKGEIWLPGGPELVEGYKDYHKDLNKVYNAFNGDKNKMLKYIKEADMPIEDKLRALGEIDENFGIALEDALEGVKNPYDAIANLTTSDLDKIYEINKATGKITLNPSYLRTIGSIYGAVTSPFSKATDKLKTGLEEQNKAHLIDQLRKNVDLFDEKEDIQDILGETKNVNELFDKVKPYIQELYDKGLINK